MFFFFIYIFNFIFLSFKDVFSSVNNTHRNITDKNVHVFLYQPKKHLILYICMYCMSKVFLYHIHHGSIVQETFLFFIFVARFITSLLFLQMDTGTFEFSYYCSFLFTVLHKNVSTNSFLLRFLLLISSLKLLNPHFAVMWISHNFYAK